MALQVKSSNVQRFESYFKSYVNFRPISNTISKLLYKILQVRLWCYLENNKICSTRQLGFQKGISAQNAIIPELTLGIGFCQLFEGLWTVNHELLLISLEDIGARGVSLKLFERHLSMSLSIYKNIQFLLRLQNSFSNKLCRYDHKINRYYI